jgi:hypothetical protein
VLFIDGTERLSLLLLDQAAFGLELKLKMDHR